MFEKEAEEWRKSLNYEIDNDTFYNIAIPCMEFGYSKAKEDIKHDLMMKLKDEGLVKPLKDSILRNERLSSQEQQELCAWIECAMDFGENLDECAKELTEAKELLAGWLRLYKTNTVKGIITDTEQFLKEEYKK